MGKKGIKSENLEKQPSLSKETQESFGGSILWGETFYAKHSDLDFWSWAEWQLELLLYCSPNALALYQNRQSFVTRPFNLSGNEKSEEYQFIKKHFWDREDIDIYELCLNIQNAVLFGISIQELTWEMTEDGFWRIKEFHELPSYPFDWKDKKLYLKGFGEDKKPLSSTQVLAVRYNPLAKDKPVGLLRTIARSLLSERDNEQNWDVAGKKFNNAILAAFLTAGQDSKERKQVFLSAAKGVTMGGGSGLAMNHGEDLKLIEPSSKGNLSSAFLARSREFGNKFSKLMLGQTLTTDTGSQSSYAAAKVHEGTMDHLSKKDKLMVCKALNKLIKVQVDVNFPNPQEYPKFTYDDLYEISLGRAERDTKLFGMGVRFKKNYFKERHNLENDEFELIEIKNEIGGA